MEGKKRVICEVCINFEPQAWRKSLCRNCFHLIEEHAEDDHNTETEKKDKESKTLSSIETKPESNLTKSKTSSSSVAQPVKDKNISQPGKAAGSSPTASAITTPAVKPPGVDISKDTVSTESEQISSDISKVIEKTDLSKSLTFTSSAFKNQEISSKFDPKQTKTTF